jgi:hypothetical protein
MVSKDRGRCELSLTTGREASPRVELTSFFVLTLITTPVPPFRTLPLSPQTTLMSRTTVDEAALLRKYRIRTLEPTRWEDVDYELEGGVIGDMTSGMEASGSGTVGGGEATKEEPDPLGLRGSVK